MESLSMGKTAEQEKQKRLDGEESSVVRRAVLNEGSQAKSSSPPPVSGFVNGARRVGALQE